MKKFLGKILLFVFIIGGALLIGLFIPWITKPQNLHFALSDKHSSLKKKVAPRIILVGGSNLSFGIKSESLAKAFHIPVVNTSIHAGMGLKYIMEDILPYIQNTDIVILAAEYDHFFGDNLYGYDPMISSIVANPSNLKLINLENWRELISLVPKDALKNIIKYALSKVKSVFNAREGGVYDRTSFNAYGDVIAHYDLPAEEFVSSKIESEYNPKTIRQIINFKKELEAKGALLLVTFPCLNQSSYQLYPEKISKVEEEFLVNNFTMLGTPKRYSFSDSLYYNGKYHLTEAGIRIRTSLLIEDLSHHFPEK